MSVSELANDKVWYGGWYQPIEFPNGEKTESSKWENFFSRDDFGERKWNRLIKPYLYGENSFLEIGCNAGLFLVLAEKYGFKNVYGLESFKYFFDQCQYVLSQFKSRAIVYQKDALNFNFDSLESVDTVLLANALYWIGYSDNGKYVDNYNLKMNKFIRGLSFLTKRIIIIGGEKVERIGGNLDLTTKFIEPYFNIIKSEVITTGYRVLNLIVADSKVVEGEQDIDFLINDLSARGDYATEFIETFSKMVEGYLSHKQWMIKHSESFRGGRLDNLRLSAFCINYLQLMASIEEKGLLKKIKIFSEDGKAQIDGWHRLIILKALGYKTIPYKKINNG